MWSETAALRAIDMAAAYRQGTTLADIGVAHGLSRERVRQIIRDGFGYDKHDGGAAVRSLLKVGALKEKRRGAEARCFRKWGLTLAEYEAHIAEWGCSSRIGSPMQRFIAQRNNAAKRSIEWSFTFREWWSVWAASGRWAQRGRGHGYVMARYGDCGAYAMGNVEIITAEQNARDSYLVHPATERVVKRNRAVLGANPMAATHCKRGHLKSEHRNRHGNCRLCNRIASRAHKARVRHPQQPQQRNAV